MLVFEVFLIVFKFVLKVDFVVVCLVLYKILLYFVKDIYWFNCVII